MTFKFENLEVWQIALDYVDLIYELAEKLPDTERYNLKSQITRAATSIALNIAEGSTGQSDAEQSRFLSMAIRSLIETVACQRIISRRNYVSNQMYMDQIDLKAQEFAKRLHAFRRSLSKTNKSLREDPTSYETDKF